IGAQDQKGNRSLDAAGATLIDLTRRMRSGRWSKSVHLFTSWIWMLIRFPLTFGLNGTGRGVGIDKLFPDLFFPQPRPEYQAEDQCCKDSSCNDPKKEQHSFGVPLKQRNHPEGLEGGS